MVRAPASPAVDIDYKAYPLLFVDDEADIIETFRFGYEGSFTILSATCGTEALALLAREPVAVLVTDQRMPEMSGLDVISRALELKPDVIPIIVTGFTDLDSLVSALNLGRIHRYITKPWDHHELRLALRRAVESYHLAAENARLAAENARLVVELREANARLASDNRYLRTRNGGDKGFATIVGTSHAIRQVVDTARRVAGSPTTVLLEGPSGSGKELIARAIHDESPRRDRLFVGVNCGALPRDLLASTLFGHRKGAFTGAQADRRGLFDTADGGTLFLDEVTEASPEVQVHLLRALQEGEVTPVGATHPVKVDVRVIVATNRDLTAEVERRSFREDLYYRLSVFRIRVPSLHERPSDIPALVEHLIHRHSVKLNRSAPAITPEAMALLQCARYRGNVRELANAIERALILVDPDRPIDVGDLDSIPDTSAEATLEDDMAHFEREQIRRALEMTGGNKTQAAKSLGVTYRGLLKKMQRLRMP